MHGSFYELVLNPEIIEMILELPNNLSWELASGISLFSIFPSIHNAY